MPAKSNVTLCLVIAALATAPATAAFSQATASKMDGVALSNDKPIHIESDKLEIKDKENRADFTGNVVATQGSTMLKSKTMTVYYKSSGKDGANNSGGAMANAGNGDIDRILVNGGVVLNSDKQTATAESGHFEMAKQLFVLEGKQVVLSDGNNVFTGCRLTVHMDTGQAQLDSCGGRVQIQLDPKSRSK
ncbi:lipopolysaccharide export system protein LptA [Rhizobium aquaticum]|uniref:Lipopolysaccharide export system protein LptA n=1 Tax=Rhizobium aquaticum TaxID=1549636 RepID=A0ABV2IYV5_9HYPH